MPSLSLVSDAQPRNIQLPRSNGSIHHDLWLQRSIEKEDNFAVSVVEGFEGSRSKRVESDCKDRASPRRRRRWDKGRSSRARKGNLEGMLLDVQRRVSKRAKKRIRKYDEEESGSAHSRWVDENSSLRKVRAHGMPA